METKEKHPEQADFTSRTPGLDRNTRGPLGVLTLIAFLGYVLMYFVAFFRALLIDGDFVPPIVIFAVFLLLVAGVVATRWRWAPLLGAFVSLVTAALVLPRSTQHLRIHASRTP